MPARRRESSRSLDDDRAGLRAPLWAAAVRARPDPLPLGITEAYLATRYVILAPPAEHAVRIGLRCRFADAVMSAAGHSSGYILTAHNPGNQLRNLRENRAAETDLRAWATRTGLPVWETENRSVRDRWSAEGVGGTGDWPIEPGVFITGLSPHDAVATARRFGQVALVALKWGATASLIYP